METGRPESRFQMGFRFFENMTKGEYPSDGRFGFDYLDDNESIIMTMGSRLIIWKYKSE
jgi:hypothetical protein